MAQADQNPATREAAIAALAKVGAPGKQEVGRLVELWRDQSAGKRALYADAICTLKLDPDSTAVVFVPALKNPEKALRIKAAQVLGEAGAAVHEKSFSELLRLADDVDGDVRAAARAALVKLGTPTANDRFALQDGLSGKSSEVRCYSRFRSSARSGRMACRALHT